MADPLHQPELDEAVRQQPQRPALLPFGRGATGQRKQVGFDLARQLLGRTWR